MSESVYGSNQSISQEIADEKRTKNESHFSSVVRAPAAAQSLQTRSETSGAAGAIRLNLACMIREASIPSLAASFRVIAGQDFGKYGEHPAKCVGQIAGIVNIPDRHE
jgi:hypothetical protein